jgi:tetratricopeptide (TPR) repeat protein
MIMNRLYLILLCFFIQVFSLKAQDFQTYYNLGNKYLNKNQLDSALIYFDKAKTIKPDTTVVYLQKSFVYWFLGDREKSINECTKAIEIDSTCSKAYVTRADKYIKSGQTDKAAKDYKKAIVLSPKDYDTFYSYTNLAILAEEENKLDSAIDYYSRGIELTKLYKYYQGNGMYFYRGKLYLKKGDDKNAFNDFNKSIKLGFNYSDCYYQRGLLFQKFGDNWNAKYNMEKSIKLKREETKNKKKPKKNINKANT